MEKIIEEELENVNGGVTKFGEFIINLILEATDVESAKASYESVMRAYLKMLPSSQDIIEINQAFMKRWGVLPPEIRF